MVTQTKTTPSLKQPFDPIHVWAYIAIAWALYRYFFKFSEAIDELIFKPLIFVLPVILYVLKKEKRPLASLGLVSSNFVRNMFIGIGFGIVFVAEGIFANISKYGSLQMAPLDVVSQYGIPVMILLTFATALTEEIMNRGFLFNRMYEQSRNLIKTTLITALLFMILHIPVLVTSLHLQGTALILFFATDFILALANNMLFAFTGSLVAPILVHIFWNMTVLLFL